MTTHAGTGGTRAVSTATPVASLNAGRISPGVRGDRALLGGMLAAPLFFAVGLAQAFTRDGFDLRRDPLSLLSNGDLGWLQITNFMVSGALFLVAARALRPRFAATSAGRWTARLIGVNGLGMIGAGIFRADPAFGFPPGTPAGAPQSVSWHGSLHLLVGSVGFLALIAATFTAARLLRSRGSATAARSSRVIGVLFLLGLGGLGANTAATNFLFVATAALGLGWASWLAARARGVTRAEVPVSPTAAPTVTSRDGTRIAYERHGAGPAVVLVDGPFGSRTFGPNVALASRLASRFTVYHYDRRGTGDSSSTQPYSVDREVEDLDAILDAAGGTAAVYGLSAGALLAVDAARALPHKISRLALFEPPCVVDDTRKPFPVDYCARVTQLVTTGRRGEAVTLFLREAAALPGFLVTLTRISPAWSRLTAAAGSLVHNAHVMGDTGSGNPLSAHRFAVEVPALVVDGGNSPAWLHHAADAVAALLPHAERRTLPGQTHQVKAKAIAPVLEGFFTASTTSTGR